MNVCFHQFGFRKRDLVVLVVHTIHHDELGARGNGPRLRIHDQFQIATCLYRLLSSTQKSTLDSLNENLPFDSFFLLEVFEHGDEFSVHGV